MNYQPAEDAVHGWINSPKHRENLEKGAYHYQAIGVGAYVTGKTVNGAKERAYYFTQLFSYPREAS